MGPNAAELSDKNRSSNRHIQSPALRAPEYRTACRRSIAEPIVALAVPKSVGCKV